MSWTGYPVTDLQAATDRVVRELDELTFDDKVDWSYNPLRYARTVHDEYLDRYADGSRQALFLGMNPGPWGMGQTGVPFSDTTIASEWMELPEKPVDSPANERDDRLVLGWDCERTEGSGQRLYGYVREAFDSVPTFLTQHTVINYCPLLMFGEDATNVTPEDLLVDDRRPLFEICDPYLEAFLDATDPDVLIGIGRFGESRLEAVAGDHPVHYIPHPSPASPIATRDGGEYWRNLVTETLTEVGLNPRY